MGCARWYLAFISHLPRSEKEIRASEEFWIALTPTGEGLKGWLEGFRLINSLVNSVVQRLLSLIQYVVLTDFSLPKAEKMPRETAFLVRKSGYCEVNAR